MKATAPEATASGTTTGAAAAARAVAPRAEAPTTTAPEAAAPRAAPEPAATALRPALTSEVPVMVRESCSPARPVVTALVMVMVGIPFFRGRGGVLGKCSVVVECVGCCVGGSKDGGGSDGFCNSREKIAHLVFLSVSIRREGE